MYGKVFPGLFTGSLHGQPAPQLVFVFLIANCDPDGNADAHPKAIASMTGLPLEHVEAALEQLQSADSESRSPDDEGRRILKINPSLWHVVNYHKYRTLVDGDTVRAQTRERVKNHRARKRSVTLCNAQKRQGEGEGEGEEKKTPLSKPTARTDVEGFAEWYENEYPRHVKRPDAMRAFASAISRGHAVEQITEGTRAWYRAWEARGTPQALIPHPATFLNAEQYLDIEEAEVLTQEAHDEGAQRQKANGRGWGQEPREHAGA